MPSIVGKVKGTVNDAFGKVHVVCISRIVLSILSVGEELGDVAWSDLEDILHVPTLIDPTDLLPVSAEFDRVAFRVFFLSNHPL